MTTNSYANYLQGLYTAMISDIAESRPHLRVDSERDLKRLLSIVEKVGVRFFLIDLPAMGKHFDKCLSQRQLTRSGLPYQRPFKTGSPIPRLFRGLHLSVFDKNGVLKVDPDLQAIKFLRQLYRAAKRFRISCSDATTWEHVNAFFKVDSECLRDSLGWEFDDISLDDIGSLDLLDCHPSRLPRDTLPLFGEGELPWSPSNCDIGLVRTVQWTADLVAATLGRFEPLEWRAKHGPGATSDHRRTVSKYVFPTWPEKLDSIFPISDFGFSNHGVWADFVSGLSDLDSSFARTESPSKLISVPKELSGPRLIASEPVSHQWCQQVILDFLANSVPRLPISASISFSDQSKNGRLALSASHSQSHVTVDLSSASDRLSCWHVERFFRRSPTLVAALHASRTRFLYNGIDKKSPRYHILRKFSTMGSAVTFPVQTYIFTILCIGSLLHARRLAPSIANMRRLSREVQVFGDDIIIPIDGWSSLQEIFEYLRLKVNPDKTYSEGNFRESCGVDAFDGNDVTKVSVLSAPDVSRPGSIVSSVDTHNNFYSKGYYRTAEFIKSTVCGLRQNLAIPTVQIGSGVFGWHDHMGFDPSILRKRWNSLLQRVEYRVLQPYAVMRRQPFDGGQTLLQYFTEVKRTKFVQGERLGVASVSKSKLGLRWEGISSFV